VYVSDFVNLVEKNFKKGSTIEMSGRKHLLSIALKKGYYKTAIILIKSLVNTEEDIINLKYEGKTPFHQVLLDNRLNINERIELLKILRNYGADPTIPINNQDPLSIIINSEYSETLINIFFGQIDDDNKENKMYCKIKKIDPEIITLAIKLKKIEIIRILLNNGIDINYSNDHNPLHTIFNSMITSSVVDNKNLITILNILLKHGSNVNHTNDNNMIPLHVACLLGKTIAVKMLLNAGSDPFLIDNYGESSLIKAVKSSSLDIIKILLKLSKQNKYLVNIPNKKGLTAAMIALKSNKSEEIIQILYGFNMTDFEMIDMQGKNILDHLFEQKHKNKNNISRLLINKINFLKLNSQYNNLLIRAVYYDYSEIIEMMINNLIKRKIFRLKDYDIISINSLYEKKVKNIDFTIICTKETYYFPLIWIYLSKEYDIKKVLGNTNYFIQKKTLCMEDEFNIVQELVIYLTGISLLYVAKKIDQNTGLKDRIYVDEIESDNESNIKIDIDRLGIILQES